MAAEAPYQIFSLTKMTGRESKDLRTTMVLGFETPFRPFAICLLGGLVGIFFSIFLWSAIGSFVIFVPVITSAGAWWLFERRSKTGLRLRTWEDMRDSRKAKPTLGEFMLCGVVIGIDDEAPAYLSLNTAPADAPAAYQGRRRTEPTEVIRRAPGVAAGAIPSRPANPEDEWFS